MLKTSFISLLCVFCVFSADAALRVSNTGAGRGNSMIQGAGAVAVVPSQQEVIATARTSAELGLPVRVADMNLARRIAAGEMGLPVNRYQLDSCAAIYPMGSFAWDTANAGIRGGTGCVAEVELRMINGTDDIVLARARLAAGDSMDCNISAFPADGYTEQAGQVIFPADREPTMEDVRQVMNQEQKQNAGLRIAAATIIGGLGGNFVGQNAPGKGGALGVSGDKMTKTAIGALTLGGLTAVSTQTGKVGGDVVMGAAVNAIGGGLIGNISGIGNSALVTRKCEGGLDCLYGIVAKNTGLGADKAGFYGSRGGMVRCNAGIGADGANVFDSCGTGQFSYWAMGNLNQGSKAEDVQRYIENSAGEKFCLKNGKMEQTTTGICDGEEAFVRMSSAQVMENPEPAVIVGWNARLSKFGDWTAWRAGNNSADIRYRYNDGTIGRAVPEEYTAANFTPLTQDASDGAIIDLNNRARAGTTATGAGVGAGLGGFSAYQGAKTDIENRWVAEVQAYKDSLGKIYCGTGTRFLSQYNDMATIPAMQ